MNLLKATAVKAGDHQILFISKKTDLSKAGIAKEEIKTVSEGIKKERRNFNISSSGKSTFIHIVDDKKSGHLLIESSRRAGASILNSVNEAGIEKVTISGDIPKDQMLAFIEGIVLANYQFLKYKGKLAKKEQHSLQTLNVVSKEISDAELNQLALVIDATNIARDLVNEPPNTLTATRLSDEFKRLGKEAGFKVEVLRKLKIESLKMGGLLAVNRGSVEPPTFTIMEYKPAKVKNKKPVVLVGKGVVYDTGGLSLKPTPNSMDLMKCDMAGAATVGAAMYAIAKAKLPVHVVALVPATDNRPGENAYCPGDIITMFSGLQVEMLNSDAEGRMILADALHYAKKYSPELVLEFSTLTGAAMAAIGTFGIVTMGNADEETKLELKASGDAVYERLAEMPFWEEYEDLIKSDVAEIKNIGGPYGGAITAGKFLEKFTDYPFMHFDIAGPAFLSGKDGYRPKGGTGVGVRLLFDFLKNY